ncbi:cation-translocating P-type ATPase [Melghirimyces profundicolus]|uniref:cation-translocating P-type ATPase n=1 Tax=Melghirimyces profundicolus TaxID=1242148 RepID=UPI001FEC3EFC|nr:HAD-IC family P-type ATPase [Melghirimyces profundicolus]
MSVDERKVRWLPGRVRIQLAGLKGSHLAAETLKKRLESHPGIRSVHLCPRTGRALIHYCTRQMTGEAIFQLLMSVEDEWLREEMDASHKTGKPASQTDTDPGTEPAASPAPAATPALVEAAATREMRHPLPVIPERFRRLPKISPYDPDRGKTTDRPPLPLILTLGGLTGLAVKQAWMGKSALARSPLPFYLSGALSVMTGYPFLRRGIRKLTQKRGISSDLVLGAGALALALVRENLVVLAGLGILQFIDWKHRRMAGETDDNEEEYIDPEIRRYAEKSSRFGSLLAGATLALTRDPMRGLAVLLASNPRTATVSCIPAWKRAEWTVKKAGWEIPDQGSLPRLAHTRTVLFEDDTLLFRSRDPKVYCITDGSETEEKVWRQAASLLKKSDHDWKLKILEKAGESGRTIRTAFQMQESNSGVSGQINQQEFRLGSLEQLEKSGVQCENLRLNARRLLRKGNRVELLARKTGKEFRVIALFYQKQEQLNPDLVPLLRELQERKVELGVLRLRSVSEQTLVSHGLDPRWASLKRKTIQHKIREEDKQNRETLLVCSDRPESLAISLIHEGVPWIHINRLSGLLPALKLAVETQEKVSSHFRFSRLWNMIGTVLALPFRMSALTINLIADALSLFFISRVSREPLPFLRTHKEEVQALKEVSATAESALPSSDQAPEWHSLTAREVLHRLQVDQKQGLDLNRVKERRERFGSNRLQTRKPTPWMVTYLEQFKEFSTLLLLGTTTLSFLTGDLFHGIAMSVILLANAAVGAIQERKAEKVVERLNEYQPPVCRVVRGGKTADVSGDELVPGDVVHLEAGDRVPADLRLLLSWDLEVNESILTGESASVLKNPEPVDPDCPLSDRTNMLFMGTNVNRGKGIGVVVNTGPRTEMGRLVSFTKKEKQVTPLQERVTSISKTFVKGALMVAGVVFAAGFIRGVPIAQMVGTSVALAASAIPEGLPVTVTIALSAGIFRMAKKSVLIRRLSALETLGRTTVVCSDKTGTLTQNEMTVKKVLTVEGEWHVEGNGYQPDGEIRTPDGKKADALSQPELTRLLDAALLCNNSELTEQEGHRIVKGDPTEGALITLAEKAGIKHHPDTWERVHEIPFDSSHGRMSVVCQEHKKNCYLFTKGSTEAVLERCAAYQVNGDVLPLTDEVKKRIQQRNESLASQAMRVLSFAYAKRDETISKEDRDLIFLGMVGMIDPPKPGVAESIQHAKNMGVRPVMITGDHPLTANAIAHQIGLGNGETHAVTGKDLDQMSDEELEREISRVHIFARVTPQHKLRIVEAYRKQGHVVAMTGDGVNDVPAIQQADVGIAMGKTGTEVTKESADMVLVNDGFASIVEGVKEGRTIIGNIRKALGCLLTGNLAEILVTGIAVIAGLPIPLIPIQILLMNLMTDALPAMVLAVNPGQRNQATEEKDIVDRDLYRKVITRGTLLGVGSLGLFIAHLVKGAPLLTAQTVAFATLVLGQMFQTLSWRQEGSSAQENREAIGDGFKDRFLAGAMGISVLTLLAVMYVPPLSRILQTTPIALRSWGPILLVSGLVSKVSDPLLAFMKGLERAQVAKERALPVTA